jgi:hypothetical protein
MVSNSFQANFNWIQLTTAVYTQLRSNSIFFHIFPTTLNHWFTHLPYQMNGSWNHQKEVEWMKKTQKLWKLSHSRLFIFQVKAIFFVQWYWEPLVGGFANLFLVVPRSNQRVDEWTSIFFIGGAISFRDCKELLENRLPKQNSEFFWIFSINFVFNMLNGFTEIRFFKLL